MDLRSIYVANGTGIFILIMLYYTSRTKISRQRIDDRLYSFMVLCVMLSCAMEMLSYTLDGRVFPGARVLNYIANTYLFSVNLLLPFTVLVYMDYGLYEDMGRIWRLYRPQIIIGIIMLGVNIVNFFVPISYTITPENVYERRPFSYVYYVVIFYYCATCYSLTKRYERENGASAFFSIGMFLFPILIGAGLQFMFYGLSLAWLSSAVGLVGLFMMQQNELAYIDPLVDTYNRQYMNHILQAWMSRGWSFAGVMIDMDHFKEINDSFGHSEGDAALKSLAGLLKQSRQDREWVFRFAGDEFIVLKLTDHPEELEVYMSAVNRQIAAYNREKHLYQLSLSYGISAHERGTDIDTFLRTMDGRMYEMKERHHQAA